MAIRTCAHCGETKPLEDFASDASQPLGRSASCKQCKNKASREWKKRNPDKVNAANRRRYHADPERWRLKSLRSHRKHADKRKAYLRKWRAENPEQAHDTRLWHTYKMPRGTYARLLAEQGGGCAICGVSEAGQNGPRPAKWLYVDHCHTTGQIRGLLCYKCNTALGHLNDDPERMRRLIAYLLKYSPD